MRLSALLAATILVLSSSTSWSTTWSVRDDGTGDVPTIQDAINAAANGDSIILAPGHFTGPGNRDIDTMGKALVITSRHGPTATEIDAGYVARIIHIHQGEGETTEISNIRIAHGAVSDPSGAGIRCDGTSPRLVDMEIGPNHYLALEIVNGASVDVIRCRFIDDAGPGYQFPPGAAIRVNAAAIRMIGSSISGFKDAAIHAYESDVVMVGNTIQNNGQFDVEGVSYFYDCTVSILGNTIRSNIGWTGSGIMCDSCNGEVRSNWIEGNRTNLDGAGAEWASSTGDVSFNFLRENDEGIRLRQSNGSVVRNLVIRSQETCCWAGRGIDVSACEATTIANNTLYQNGGQYMDSSPGAELSLWGPQQPVRNIIVGSASQSFVACYNLSGCIRMTTLDTTYVDDPSNVVSGNPAGIFGTLQEACFQPELIDPLFRDEADDNFFLQAGSLAIVDTIVGSWHIVRRWGALPKAAGPADALDVQVPPDDTPGVQAPASLYPLNGFAVTNTSVLDVVVNYRLVADGGTLNDNGDPLSLLGTSPVLAPGESFVPPTAALVVPDGSAIAQIKYMFAYAPALNIVDSLVTIITFARPVPVRLTSFSVHQEGNGVRLTWETAAGTAEHGWLINREGGDTGLRRLTSLPLVAGTRGFLDVTAHAGVRYRYQLLALAPDESIAGEVEIVPSARLALQQNVPNPFNPETTIEFSLPASGHAVLAVYSVDGGLVRVLRDGVLAGGVYRETWDGTDARGNPLASGVYFCRLTAGNHTMTRKMVLAK